MKAMYPLLVKKSLESLSLGQRRNMNWIYDTPIYEVLDYVDLKYCETCCYGN